MSMISKFWPMDIGTCVLEVTITPDQLQQEAKDFVIQLSAAGISPAGLHFEDFVPVVLRRRMENLAIEAKRLGFNLGRSNMVLNYELPEEEGPCIQFRFASEADAVNFKIMLL